MPLCQRAAMGNVPMVLLFGACALRRVAAAVDCTAHTESDCHDRIGCRWFSYTSDGDCRLCNSAYPDKTQITGCRDWTPFYYCRRVHDELIQTDSQHLDVKPELREAVKHYHISQGSGEAGNPRTKTWRCSVWCDAVGPFACTAQPRAVEEFRGVNYGGRFVPEQYLGLNGTAELFHSVHFPPVINGRQVQSVSLCDVGDVPNAAERMWTFLDKNIVEEHFHKMAALGFNVVRLPLGYWNLVNLPHGSVPNSASPDRWRSLQSIMPAQGYQRWIDRVFVFARSAGLQVLLDLHGAPGAQTGNAFTGCDQGKGNYNFNTEWNKQLAVQAVERMAQICKQHGTSCYGIELLNEPEFGEDQALRFFLKGYYEEAIRAARKHVEHDTPLVIMDWTRWMAWWRDQASFPYQDYGRVLFSTHLYDAMGVEDQEHVRDLFKEDISTIEDIFLRSKYEVIVSEYSLSGHGNGTPKKDSFDYHALANWLVHQMGQRSLGSAVWNYDSAASLRSWGPVANSHLGARPVDWAEIFGVHGSTRAEAETIATHEGLLLRAEEHTIVLPHGDVAAVFPHGNGPLPLACVVLPALLPLALACVLGRRHRTAQLVCHETSEGSDSESRFPQGPVGAYLAVRALV